MLQLGITLRICSQNSSYNKCCTELEVWLREQGYIGKFVRQQLLKDHKHKRTDLLNNIKDKINDYKFVLNITYHPNFSNLKDTISFLHLLLPKSLRDILLRAKVSLIKKNEGFCGPCKRMRSEICEHIMSTKF